MQLRERGHSLDESQTENHRHAIYSDKNSTYTKNIMHKYVYVVVHYLYIGLGCIHVLCYSIHTIHTIGCVYRYAYSVMILT